MKIRLAILDADILYPPLQAVHHSYGRMFTALFEAVGADWDIRIYPVINGVYPESTEDFDACLITGSKYDSFGGEDWIVLLREYVRSLYALGKPLVGICFGHQLLAHALGGHSGRSNAGWGLGVMSYTLHERPAFLGDVGEENDETQIRLIVSHQDQVHQLPDDAQLLLSNDFCPNAAFYIPGRVLALQGHPEFTVNYALDLLAHREQQLPPDVVRKARATLSQGHDGTKAGHWIRCFVGG